jgi:hypothetical protein
LKLLKVAQDIGAHRVIRRHLELWCKWLDPGKSPWFISLGTSRRKRQTVRILWRGFAKSRQSSDLVKKWGGYGCVRSSSSRDREPSDHHPVTRQPSDLTGVAQGLNPREQRENPEKDQGFGHRGSYK